MRACVLNLWWLASVLWGSHCASQSKLNSLAFIIALWDLSYSSQVAGINRGGMFILICLCQLVLDSFQSLRFVLWINLPFEHCFHSHAKMCTLIHCNNPFMCPLHILTVPISEFLLILSSICKSCTKFCQIQSWRS